MTKRLRPVACGDAEEGMVLGADLRDSQGAVLLPAGTALTAAALRSLARRGVATLMVAEEREDGEAPEAARERLAARLDHLFRKCGTRACAELRREVEAFRMDELA